MNCQSFNEAHWSKYGCLGKKYEGDMQYMRVGTFNCILVIFGEGGEGELNIMFSIILFFDDFVLHNETLCTSLKSTILKP